MNFPLEVFTSMEMARPPRADFHPEVCFPHLGSAAIHSRTRRTKKPCQFNHSRKKGPRGLGGHGNGVERHSTSEGERRTSIVVACKKLHMPAELLHCSVVARGNVEHVFKSFVVGLHRSRTPKWRQIGKGEDPHPTQIIRRSQNNCLHQLFTLGNKT